MRAAPITKYAPNSNIHASKPFFRKSGEGSYFSGANETDASFFSNPVIQTKLAVGKPGDKYEQEADAMAEKVVEKNDVSGSNHTIQNKCEDCENEEKLQKKEISKISSPVTQRKEEDKADPKVETQLQESKGGGQDLDKNTRQNMEQSFGTDFTGVKVHTANNAIQMNQSLNAKAFTNGSDIYFNKGQYAPDSREGKKLLAHELTHVVQQGGSDGNIQRHTCENDASVGSSLGLSCNIDSSPNPGPTEAISFSIESSNVTDVSALSNFVDNWIASGSNEPLIVNGFASCDGAEAYNWRLSCRRANALATELISLGVDPSMITIFANGETDHFSSSNLGANRIATVGFGGTPGPAPPTPNPPTPRPGIPTVVPCNPTPKQIFSRGACGAGTDFTHNDFPSLSGVSSAKRAAVWEADNLTFDFQLRNRMRLELGALARSEGLRMVTHFSGGTGSKLTHGTSSVLGPLALASGMFSRLHAAVKTGISSQLSSMHASGVIDCNTITLSSVPASHFAFSDGTTLKAIIGGTQGLEINITSFSVNPRTRDFSISLQYVICDDFGVDRSDLYSPALIAFWVLQHRRSGNLPFINELDLPKTTTGTY